MVFIEFCALERQQGQNRRENFSKIENFRRTPENEVDSVLVPTDYKVLHFTSLYSVLLSFISKQFEKTDNQQ